MTDLLLIGGGGHCRSCIDVIEAEGRHQIRGIVGPLPNETNGEPNETDGLFGYSVLGSDEDLPCLLQEVPQALVSVGQIRYSQVRVRLYELLKKYGGILPKIISPSAYCSRYADIDEGTIVMHGAIVNAQACIGANCIINSQALIEHDVTVADHCHVSTGARVNGAVSIGQGSFIGSGAILKEGVVIGENVIIGAGQVILCDIPSGVVLRHDR